MTAQDIIDAWDGEEDAVMERILDDVEEVCDDDGGQGNEYT